MKNVITELKNSPKGFNRRCDQVEERISKINDRSCKITEAEELKQPKNNVEKGKQQET